MLYSTSRDVSRLHLSLPRPALPTHFSLTRSSISASAWVPARFTSVPRDVTDVSDGSSWGRLGTEEPVGSCVCCSSMIGSAGVCVCGAGDDKDNLGVVRSASFLPCASRGASMSAHKPGDQMPVLDESCTCVQRATWRTLSIQVSDVGPAHISRGKIESSALVSHKLACFIVLESTHSMAGSAKVFLGVSGCIRRFHAWTDIDAAPEPLRCCKFASMCALGILDCVQDAPGTG